VTTFGDFDSLVQKAFEKALSASKPMSREMTRLLYLVIVEEYELFGAKRDERTS
jgi:hypothetical protein